MQIKHTLFISSKENINVQEAISQILFTILNDAFDSKSSVADQSKTSMSRDQISRDFIDMSPSMSLEMDSKGNITADDIYEKNLKNSDYKY